MILVTQCSAIMARCRVATHYLGNAAVDHTLGQN